MNKKIIYIFKKPFFYTLYQCQQIAQVNQVVELNHQKKINH